MKNDKYSLFTISINDSQKRVDNVIRKFLPDMPIKSIFKSIRSGDIRVNSKKIKQDYRLNEGDILAIYKPFLSHSLLNNKTDSKVSTKLNKKRVVYEDSNILVYNKPYGVLVHGDSESLDKQVKDYLISKVEDSLSFTPGPLHRLDRNTQGLIIFSVSLNGARDVSKMIQSNLVEKVYLALVDGIHTKKETWKDNLDRNDKTKTSFKSDTGQEAISHFIPLISGKNKTLALIKIDTGRTHQIRVQCSIHNRPLTGDLKYNKESTFKNYYLAAISLSFMKKSDIIVKENFILSIKKTEISLLKNFFTLDEIEKIDTLIKKELKSNESY